MGKSGFNNGRSASHHSLSIGKNKSPKFRVEVSAIVFARCIFVKKMRDVRVIYFLVYRDR